MASNFIEVTMADGRKDLINKSYIVAIHKNETDDSLMWINNGSSILKIPVKESYIKLKEALL